MDTGPDPVAHSRKLSFGPAPEWGVGLVQRSGGSHRQEQVVKN